MPATITAVEIRQLRRDLNLTQAELAERLGLNPSTVCHWETNRSSPTGPAELMLRQMQAGASLAANRSRAVAS